MADEIKNDGLLKLTAAGRTAREIYLTRRPISLAFPEIDQILDGGLEAGNYYLFLGAAKSGKTTTLRSLAIRAARTGYPVLYANFEQPGENTYAKIYNLLNNAKFQEEVSTNGVEVVRRIESLEQDIQPGVNKLQSLPLWIAFWPKGLETLTFNGTIKEKLKESIVFIQQMDPDNRRPLIIIENLADIYSERLHGNDNLTNIATQTAQDIKRFAMTEDVPVLLAHHSAKLDGREPQLDDARDSKRVVDLAHSIFTTYVENYEDALGFPQSRRILKYLGGRGMGEVKKWIIALRGVDIDLLDYEEPPEKVDLRRIDFSRLPRAKKT